MKGVLGRASAALAGAVSLAAGASGQLSESEAEEVRLVSVLRNGDFTEPRTPGIPGFPWWKTVGDPGELVGDVGAFELKLTGANASVLQPIAAYAPWIDRVRLRCRVRGGGVLTVSGGNVIARTASVRGAPETFDAEIGEWRDPGAPLRPRLILQLSGDSDVGDPIESYWSSVEVLVPLPCPIEAALREEILGHLDAVLSIVLARALDREGDVHLPFVTRDFDAVTGETVGPARRSVGDVAFHELLLRASRAAPERGWDARVAEFLDAYAERCVHPETGLPRRWDPVEDRPLDDRPVEIRRAMGFLLDVADHGPSEWRERALALVERMARTVLARGVLPDGEVAVKYRPADGQPFFDVPQLRRLDVVEPLARLAAVTADDAFAKTLLRTAEEACLTLEYDHYWPGDWRNIDPGFDDNYGHYGGRATSMWQAHPENRVFRSLAVSGLERYAPLWRDALRYGGNVAADQVRCWKIFRDVAALEPSYLDGVTTLLDAAADSHFRGQQTGAGAWIDTTVQGFYPRSLPVGDVGGVPQNLLAGLGMIYDEGLPELRSDDTRAMFTAVLRTTVERFRQPHGFVEHRLAGDGAANPGLSGSLRLCLGLIDMLEQLSG